MAQAKSSLKICPWITLTFSAFYREPNHEALELLKAFGLHVAKELTLTRIHMNGHLNELNPRVYAVTSAEVCSF